MQVLRFLLLLPFHILRLFLFLVTFIFKLLGKLIAPLIGDINWQAPQWWAAAQTNPEALPDSTKKAPMIISLIVYALVCGTVGGIYGYEWYQNRPGEIEIAPISYQEAIVKVAKAPTPTNYREKNPAFDKLIIEFSIESAPLETLRETVTKGIKLSPEIEGSWQWNDIGTQLIFTPKKDWAVAQTYRVELNPKKLLAQTIKTETKQLEFNTDPMRVVISENEFYQDPLNPAQKKAIFHAQFNYPVDIASFEKAVSLAIMTNKGKVLENPKFSVTYNESKMDAWVHSEPIKLPEDLSKMKLLVQKGVVLSSKPNSNKASESVSVVDIPGLYTLKIKQISTSVVKNQNDKYEHVVVMNTSEDRKSTRLNSIHLKLSRMPSSA